MKTADKKLNYNCQLLYSISSVSLFNHDFKPPPLQILPVLQDGGHPEEHDRIPRPGEAGGGAVERQGQQGYVAGDQGVPEQVHDGDLADEVQGPGARRRGGHQGQSGAHIRRDEDGVHEPRRLNCCEFCFEYFHKITFVVFICLTHLDALRF